MAKSFDLGDLLSITGNRLVSPRALTGVYDVMNFVMGQSLFTHQLVIYHKQCRDHILKQHPELAEADDNSVTQDNWKEWLAEQKRRFGDTIELTPLPPQEQKVNDPITDFRKIAPDTPLIIAVPKHDDTKN